MEAAQQSCHDDKLLADLGAAATAVTQALNDLLQHIKKGAGPTAVSGIFTVFFFLSFLFSLSLSLSLYLSLSLSPVTQY